MKTRMLIVAVVLAISVSPALASTITVTSTNDSGPGSLRNALASAADGDTIDASGVSGTILLTNGELLVTNSVNIVGSGPDLLAVNGNAAGRVFYVAPSNTVSISSLTIADGHAPSVCQACSGESGGGIYNDHATITVSNCTLSGNSANYLNGGDGGGVYNDGYGGTANLMVINSVFSNNSAAGSGGAICSVAGAVTVSNCRFIGNSAGGAGGGLYNGGATMTIVSSTLGGNSTGGYGGGIYSDGYGGTATLVVANSAIYSNTSLLAGGIWSEGFAGVATVWITNTTLSANWPGPNISSDGSGGNATVVLANSTLFVTADATNGGSGGSVIAINSGTLEIGNTIVTSGFRGPTLISNYGVVTSLGYNLCSDGGGGFLTATGDQTNTNPKLGPLQDNGGPTLTHALLPGSPAINAGDPNFTPPPDYDQRGPGFPRVVGRSIDIGAFEVQNPGPAISGRFPYAFTNTPLWDLSGIYTNNSVTNDVVIATIDCQASGNITGTRTETYVSGADHAEGSGAITGKIFARAGTAGAELNEREGITGVSGGVAYTANLSSKDTATLVPSSLTILVSSRGRDCVVGTGCESVTEGFSLPLPAGMNGDWTLTTYMGSDGSKLSGTAALTLSNGRTLSYQITGSYNARTEVATLKLVGLGAAKGTSFSLTTQGSDMVLSALKGKVLGQKLNFP